MATTERARHQLYQRLNEIIGPEQADTLMELLPPVGWADVTTKTDLNHQTALTGARFDQIDARFAQVDARFDRSDADMIRCFDHLHTAVDLKIEASESRLRTEIEALRTELHRSLRINMLVTVGVLGTLTTMVGVLTSGG